MPWRSLVDTGLLGTQANTETGFAVGVWNPLIAPRSRFLIPSNARVLCWFFGGFVCAFSALDAGHVCRVDCCMGLSARGFAALVSPRPFSRSWVKSLASSVLLLVDDDETFRGKSEFTKHLHGPGA